MRRGSYRESLFCPGLLSNPLPAIQLARLKRQTDDLAAAFTQPEIFLRRLHDLLEFYADRTYRPGQAGVVTTLLPHYHVPQPVLRQIEADLRPIIIAHFEQGLALLDALWADTHYESRLLAAILLGDAPLAPAEAIIERISNWARPGVELSLLEVLLTRGSTRLLHEAYSLWLETIKLWLLSTDRLVQAVGLRALQTFISDPTFQDLPAIFNVLSPLLQTARSDLHPELLDVLQMLVKRSPSETAFFLRHVLTISTEAGTARLIRKLLPSFSVPTQNSLRDMLQQNARTRHESNL